MGILVLLGIGFLIFFAWVFKESWNQPPMSEEKFNRIFKHGKRRG